MKIKSFIFSPFQENTYLLWDEITKEAAVVDPSCLTAEEEDSLKVFISDNELNIKYLLNTHGHLDHIFGNAFIINTYQPKHFAPEKDMPLFSKAKTQASDFGIEMQQSPNPRFYFSEALELFLGKTKLNFLFTPGHTPGEFCIYLPKEKICFTGDVLFKDSIGRTDLWGGNYETLMSSIKEKLMFLPDETIIYPGHGASSTIEYERKNNQFLKHFPLIR